MSSVNKERFTLYIGDVDVEVRIEWSAPPYRPATHDDPEEGGDIEDLRVFDHDSGEEITDSLTAGEREFAEDEVIRFESDRCNDGPDGEEDRWER